MKGRLYICPTPIGNLEDISIRTLNILKECDFIACEDKRISIKLLNHYEIKKELISYHKFNEMQMTKTILDRISNGEVCALISDAGMPGISDPGHILIKSAIENKIEITVLPGANAAITALVYSGLPSNNFYFEGFLPKKAIERKKKFELYESLNCPIIIYESPNRIKSTLNEMFEYFGDMEISIARELTKIYEECIRGRLKDIIISLEDESIKGEIVLIIYPKAKSQYYDLQKEFYKYFKLGFNKKDVVKILSTMTNYPRNEIYKASLEIGDEDVFD
ncbi:MAG: 16S rRNA (cytidine(1402)-2'-O)-methyltransferase [Tissierellia bacterium]|nr:16S rRNA (cytidine(1402)-2'-O)-methyltransferase [Tissierellia bacterium]